MKPDANDILRRIGTGGLRAAFDTGAAASIEDCPHTDGLDTICAANVACRPVEWIWKNRLAIGKLTLLGGNPDMGKSQISTDAESRITRAMPWPDGGQAPQGSVIVLSSEDGPDDTIVPRLELSGADLKRVHIVRSAFAKGKPRTFSLQNDLEALGRKITEIGDVALLRLDPLSSYLGEELDSHRTSSVRAVLEPLANFAAQFQIAILGISHPPKAAQTNSLHSFSGSLAFVAAARLAFIAVKEAETGRSLLLAVKNNLGLKADGLGYRIAGGITRGGIATSQIIWDTAPVTLTADEAVGATASHKRGEGGREAETFLRELLADGPISADDGLAAAKAEGLTEATIRRARKKVGVIAAKDGYAAGWMWRLP